MAGMVGRASMVLYTGERGEVNLVTAVWNIIMATMQCCGVESYTDFNNTRWIQTRLSTQVSEDYLNKVILGTVNLLSSSASTSTSF